MDAILSFGPYKDRSSLNKFLLSIVGPYQIGMYAPLYNYNVCAAAEIKKNVKIPVVVVGGIRSLIDIAKIVNNNAADFVAMSRPFIIEPGFANSLKNKNQTESSCINCGFCIVGCFAKDVRCYYGEVS
jgi:2,4-dienoyl-CoA reductase-like NADH-dependent reductase (Old Yellow Enzyme family)